MAILTLCLGAILVVMGGHDWSPASEPGPLAVSAPNADSWHFSALVGFATERSPLADSYEPPSQSQPSCAAGSGFSVNLLRGDAGIVAPVTDTRP